MLRLTGISKAYDGAPVLDEVSLRVSAGEVVAIIGSSGCGKSTLLRIANGLVWPDRGVVEIENVCLSQANAREFRRRIGYVVQGGGLFPHLSARRNVTLASRVFGWRPGRVDERVATLAALVQLSDRELDRTPHELSGGQSQRVSLMRALMLDPGLLLLDEPLAALDPMVRAGLQDELSQLFVTLQKAVVFVTHDLAEADRVADRIVLINGGRIAQSGTLADLSRNPASDFVRRFVQAYRVPRILAER